MKKLIKKLDIRGKYDVRKLNYTIFLYIFLLNNVMLTNFQRIPECWKIKNLQL